MGFAYETIKIDLQRKILGRTWLPGIKMPSSREFAAVYNCSINTIEKALRELEKEGLLVRESRRGTFVSESAIPASVETAPLLAETIAVVVDDVNSYIFSKAFRGIEDVLKTKGYHLTISSHDNDCLRQEEIIVRLIRQGARGIILYPALSFEVDNRYYRNLEKILEKVPIVCMDRYIYNSSLSIPYVTSDNFYTAYQLTRLLVEKGHRRIGFVRNYNVSTVIERLMGFRQALNDLGVPFREDYDILLHATNETIQASSTDWLEPKLKALGLTAFFATNYNVAGHLLNGFSKIGLSIPQDVSLVSYEVEYMNSFMPTKITGVTQRLYEMGKTATRILLDRIGDTHVPDITGYVCHAVMNHGESIKDITSANGASR